MEAAHKTLQQIARNVAKVSVENQLISDEEEYVKSFNPDMIEVAYHWASGAKFSEICKLTDIFEGSIIRVLRRLEELLRQMASAAFAIGNFELKLKFEQAAISLRRGVVFAASLYI
jgi:ATP-dependent RNA helicase DOB1